MIDFLTSLDSIVWGPAMICLLLGSHIFLTFRTHFIQRKLPLAIKMSMSDESGAEGDITHFGALSTALAATIGTGSIVGVATAILAGGPGAVFWMWVAGIFGIATKYAEVYVAIKYRVKDHNGEILGGAMYAWERGFRTNERTPRAAHVMAVLFALFAALAAIGTGSAVQASAMTGTITANFDVSPQIIGIAIVVLSGVVILGGVQSISNVCEKLVPIMALCYCAGCAIIMVVNAPYLGPALYEIVVCAFTPRAAFGGAVGSGILAALQFGCARGLFSNEAGLGSAPIIAAAAQTKNPARQSLVAMTGAFWSTVVVCLLTGIVVVSTMLANPDIAASIAASPNTYSGAMLAAAVFAKIPYIGTPILVLGMVSFSYSTILGWSYYGSRCVAFLFGKRGVLPYQIVYVAVAFLGAIGVGDTVWLVSDIGNALMAIPNIIVVLALSGIVARETKHYVYDGNLDEAYDADIPVIASK